MNEVRLKYTETPAGLYVYLKFPDRDILINKELIEDVEKIKRITSYIDGLNYKILAYERYKKDLNNMLIFFRCERFPEQVIDLVRKPLLQFQDLADFNSD